MKLSGMSGSEFFHLRLSKYFNSRLFCLAEWGTGIREETSYCQQFHNLPFCPFAIIIGKKILVEAVHSRINDNLLSLWKNTLVNFLINFENFFHLVGLQGQISLKGGHRNVRT